MRYLKFIVICAILSLPLSLFFVAQAIAAPPYLLEKLWYSDGDSGESFGIWSPAFSPSIFEYTVTINEKSPYEEHNYIIFNHPKTPDNATYEPISGIGGFELKHCKTRLTQSVGRYETLSDLSDRTDYHVTFIHPPLCSTNNNLSSLSINQGSIAFNPATANYNVTVGSSVSSIALTGALADAKSSFVDGYGPTKTIDLVYGKNIAEIKVKSELDDIKTYTVTINRPDNRTDNTAKPTPSATTGDNRSANASLSSLSLSSGTISFRKDTYEYSVKVPFETESINTSAKAEDSKSTVKITGGDKISVGENKIEVIVTAENGSKAIYVVNVNRLDKGVELPNDNFLSKLSVGSQKITLYDSLTDYTIFISDEKDIAVIAKARDPKAIIKISGDKNIKDGSVVTIRVTAQDGSIKKYRLTIKSSGAIVAIVMVLSIVGLLAIPVGIFLLIKNKRKKKMAVTVLDRDATQFEIPIEQQTKPQIDNQPTPDEDDISDKSISNNQFN